MPDREKVIREFEHEVKKTHDEEWDFVYLNPNFADKLLAMLKEQQAVRITTDYVDGFGNPIANCPSCKSRLFWSSNKHYCGECGQSVLWEGR